MPRDIHIDKILDLYTIVETKMKNRKNWGKTVVLNVHNEFLEVAQIEEYVSDALMAGDPLECRVVTNDCIILMDTVVYNIKLVSSSIVLKIINVQKLDNVRKHKRYEVNLSGSFHKSDDMHEKYIIVNNVSQNGMCIITKDKLCRGDNIEVSIKCSDGCFVSLECAVLWVTRTEGNYFCGLSITYMDYRSKAIYRSLIKKLQNKEQRITHKLQEGANILLKVKE